ncbi:TetR/AcrR family transcriptional regulator [Falsirhodobacter algicola]|nr:TetR/AcrR family transcriptional regulator [Falsirhodobacter algicola]
MATFDRDDALEAAMRLFWAKGYHATSLKDLEGVLAMRPGSIYAAFQSKEGLFRAAVDRYAARMEAELRGLIAAAPQPLAALRQHLLGLAVLDPADRPSTACMLVKSLLEVPRDGTLQAFVIAHLDRIEDVLAEAIGRAVDLGELPPGSDRGRIARRIQTYIFGLKIQAQRESDPQRMADLCADLAEELAHP